jgi:hypothetical protein
MNKRIKQLELMCYEECGSYTLGSIRQLNAEKFAKLIVQDCIDIVSNYTVRMSRPGEEYLHPISEIKKHFGTK